MLHARHVQKLSLVIWDKSEVCGLSLMYLRPYVVILFFWKEKHAFTNNCTAPENLERVIVYIVVFFTNFALQEEKGLRISA